MVADVGLIGQISRLLDARPQVHLQTQLQPLVQGTPFKSPGFGIIEESQLVEDLDRFLLGFCVLGNAARLSRDHIMGHGYPHFISSIGSEADGTFVVFSDFCHRDHSFLDSSWI